MNFLPNLSKIFPHDDENKHAEKLHREMLRLESEIGGQLFGPIPKGHRREFFCLDRHTWVWHEEWLEDGDRKIVTTRYEIRPNGVLKIQDGQSYQRLTESEARNLYWAINLYGQQVDAEYERLLQAA
ncbi:MAG TPA: hypothetical protein VHA05_03165 [Candidatus Saccharimonadales bacterium]|nr:hypothetical protein [Candidatus Saccharimonadales bacterium]